MAALPLSIGTCAWRLKGPFYPIAHDEWSYLLAADTFAHGRLTNPPHPLWRHFETFDVLCQPTMMSRKPPAQGLFLALGEVLTGRPIAGAVFSVALAAVAIYWALLAWLPPPWALLGGLLAGTHPLLFDWSVTYWGGGAALLGGALALGAFRRLLDGPRPGPSVVFGLGLAVLANSRPFEGLVFVLPMAAALAWRIYRGGRARFGKRAIAAALLLGSVLLAALAFMGYYNFRITGHPLRFPYVVYEETYSPGTFFVWQKIKPLRRYRIKEFEQFFNGWTLELIEKEGTFKAYLKWLFYKFSKLDRDWLRPFPMKLIFAAGLLGLSPPALALHFVSFLIGITAFTRALTFSYFSAPGGVLFFLITLLSLRRLSALRWRGRPAGRWLVAATTAWCLANASTAWLTEPVFRSLVGADKEAIRRFIVRHGDKHLVFVRYGPDHSAFQEWVYNEADMDAARVLWARELSPDENRRLADYYKDRALWLLEVARPKAKLKFLRPAAPGT